MKIALVQMEVLEKNKAGNVQKACELLRKAAPNCDVAVLPEIWTTGYSLGHLSKEADYINGTVVNELRQIAAENSCAIVAGSIPLRKGDGNVYNTAITIGKNGEIVFCYSKVHLFSMFNEQRFFKPGNDFGVYELEGTTCASAICYDLRFPELFRHMAMQGAKIIFVPAEWPEVRGAIWDLFIRARALENHTFIVGVNCTGKFHDQKFYGHSAVISPFGEVLAVGGGEEEIVYCDIDLNLVEKANEYMNVLKDVRPELIK